MPRARKVDRLPPELRAWLQDELRQRGFGGYDDLTDALNNRLAQQGLELRLGRTAVQNYGREFRDYARLQERAQDEIRTFLAELSMAEEVDITSALFQQLTTIQWRLQMSLTHPDSMPDARGMKDLTQALNNLIRSSALRDGILRAAADRAVTATRTAGLPLTEDVADAIRRAVQGGDPA